MLTERNRAGETATYTYNADGQVLTLTNPQGGWCVTYTYNSDGTQATMTETGYRHRNVLRTTVWTG